MSHSTNTPNASPSELQRPDLRTTLNKQILVLDGAMGTQLQNAKLTAKDFGGDDLDGCNENLVFTRPDVIANVHENYLKSGAHIIETNTFGATPIVLDEYGLGHKARELNRVAAQIAAASAKKYSTKDYPRYVAGSMGPTTKAISVTGGITFNELIENFRIQSLGLIEGGADYLLLETSQDTRNVKAGLIGAREAMKLTRDIPIAVSATIEATGTMLGGQSAESFLISVSHEDLLYIGLNCATGPEFMTDSIRALAELSPFPIACIPNAGLPDENGNYLENPDMMAHVFSRFLEKKWLNLVGGCCGTHPGHIEKLSKLVKGVQPRMERSNALKTRSFLSGVDAFEVTDEARPIIVGERTNVIGSKKFRDLITTGDFDAASEIAKVQVKSGAHIIDVCLANPDRNEMDDMNKILDKMIKKVRVPLMIDSTDAKVIANALTYSQGKCIINSINLEDGEERFDEVVPLAKKFGAALVVGTIDDDPIQGMGVTRERKLSIAEKSFKLLTEKYGISPSDIYWDPLVFPCGTGDAQYIGSARETVEGIRLLKEKFPGTRSILGISNVSFGLPPAGREVLNSVFLYHCVQAGLDLAIVNSEKLERFAKISREEIDLCERTLFETSDEVIAEFAAFYRAKKASGPKLDVSTLSVEDRLAKAVVEGFKEHLEADLKEALTKYKPLDIVNGPLMKGMDEVGRLFNKNQLIVAEVLQSAEVMKAAVGHLEPLMDKDTSSIRGKVILATVKGDVHDIGKNLVDIIFSNNGFQVVNLGIKVPPQDLIKAVKEHKPDFIGLSGLLVKSAHMMATTAEELKNSGIKTPILVGGAALTQNYTDRAISESYGDGFVTYAPDAMKGLELAKALVDPPQFEGLKEIVLERRAKLQELKPIATTQTAVSTIRSKKVQPLITLPKAPDFERHVFRKVPLRTLWSYVNPLMLYGRHLGIKGGTARMLDRLDKGDRGLRRELEASEPKALQIFDLIEEVKQEYQESPFMRPIGLYQFFHCTAFENTIRVFSPKGNKVDFELLRQKEEDGVCLADYISEAKGTRDEPTDSIAFFVTSVGENLRSEANRLKDAGHYLKSHVLQALAVETAEGFAEHLHEMIRGMWGISDPNGTTMMDRFQAKYHGKRYSFGYPACPRLEDQEKLFSLLEPKSIGVELTDGFMMDPEASVSAIAFHHHQAAYFSVGQQGDNRS